MEENENKSFVDFLEDAVAEKTEILMGMEPGSKEHQMATQDIMMITDKIIQLKKAENDMNASDERLELDKERLEMERQKFEQQMEMDKRKFDHQIDNEGEEIDYRNERDKKADKEFWIKLATSLGVSVATLLAWIGMTKYAVKIDNSDMIPSGTSKRLFGLLQPFQQLFKKG